MNTNNYTKGKWHTETIEKEGEIHIFSDTYPTYAIATCYSEPLDEETKANAEIICKAVNMFPDFVDMVKRVEFLFGNEANYPEGTMGYRINKEATELLKKAEQ